MSAAFLHMSNGYEAGHGTLASRSNPSNHIRGIRFYQEVEVWSHVGWIKAALDSSGDEWWTWLYFHHPRRGERIVKGDPKQ